MADIIFSTASFQTAYRAFSVEHGQDNTIAAKKVEDTTEQNAGAQAMAQAEAVDEVFISPEAAKLYAEQVAQEKRINSSSSAEESQPKSESEQSANDGEGSGSFQSLSSTSINSTSR